MPQIPTGAWADNIPKGKKINILIITLNNVSISPTLISVHGN